MTVGQVYVLGAGLAFLAIFVTGRRLSRLKAAQNTMILTAHKILSLAAVALLVVTACRVSKATGLGAADWAASAGAGILFAATMLTGGLICAKSALPKGVHILHRVTSFLTMLVTALALYLLLAQV